MNKQEAIELMKSGYKITHNHFDVDEYMTIENNKILLEDGVRCNIDEFFSYRTDKTWEDGYSIVDNSGRNPFNQNNYLVWPYVNAYREIEEDLARMKDFGLTTKERNANIVPIRNTPKYGRNEKCNCGSGKKYKNCCLVKP